MLIYLIKIGHTYSKLTCQFLVVGGRVMDLDLLLLERFVNTGIYILCKILWGWPLREKIKYEYLGGGAHFRVIHFKIFDPDLKTLFFSGGEESQGAMQASLSRSHQGLDKLQHRPGLNPSSGHSYLSGGANQSSPQPQNSDFVNQVINKSSRLKRQSGAIIDNSNIVNSNSEEVDDNANSSSTCTVPYQLSTSSDAIQTVQSRTSITDDNQSESLRPTAKSHVVQTGSTPTRSEASSLDQSSTQYRTNLVLQGPSAGFAASVFQDVSLDVAESIPSDVSSSQDNDAGKRGGMNRIIVPNSRTRGKGWLP